MKFMIIRMAKLLTIIILYAVASDCHSAILQPPIADDSLYADTIASERPADAINESIKDSTKQIIIWNTEDNRPNPFAPISVIRFEMLKSDSVLAEMLDTEMTPFHSEFLGYLESGKQAYYWLSKLQDRLDTLPQGRLYCRLTASNEEIIIPVWHLR